jgi:hypothetical protein
MDIRDPLVIGVILGQQCHIETDNCWSAEALSTQKSRFHSRISLQIQIHTQKGFMHVSGDKVELLLYICFN